MSAQRELRQIAQRALWGSFAATLTAGSARRVVELTFQSSLAFSRGSAGVLCCNNTMAHYFRPTRIQLTSICLLAAIAAVAAVGWQEFQHFQESVSRGEALFLTPGNALPGNLVGHPGTLPSRSTQCVNCHSNRPDLRKVNAGQSQGLSQTPRTEKPQNYESAGQSFGPALTPDVLLMGRPRRGGPTSKFDPIGFCRLLRDGIDPAHIVIDQTMPRYKPSDAQCQDLWNFLTTAK